MASTLLALALSLLLVPTSTFALSAADWRSKTIYQVVTDRFYTGNLSTACFTADKL